MKIVIEFGNLILRTGGGNGILWYEIWEIGEGKTGKEVSPGEYVCRCAYDLRMATAVFFALGGKKSGIMVDA